MKQLSVKLSSPNCSFGVTKLDKCSDPLRPKFFGPGLSALQRSRIYKEEVTLLDIYL